MLFFSGSSFKKVTFRPDRSLSEKKRLEKADIRLEGDVSTFMAWTKKEHIFCILCSFHTVAEIVYSDVVESKLSRHCVTALQS